MVCGRASVVSVLFVKGIESRKWSCTVALAGAGWSEVFSMGDYSSCLRKLLKSE